MKAVWAIMAMGAICLAAAAFFADAKPRCAAPPAAVIEGATDVPALMAEHRAARLADAQARGYCGSSGCFDPVTGEVIQ